MTGKPSVKYPDDTRSPGRVGRLWVEWVSVTGSFRVELGAFVSVLLRHPGLTSCLAKLSSGLWCRPVKKANVKKKVHLCFLGVFFYSGYEPLSTRGLPRYCGCVFVQQVHLDVFEQGCRS